MTPAQQEAARAMLEALAERCEKEKSSRHLDCALYRATVIDQWEIDTFDANYRSDLTTIQLNNLLDMDSRGDRMFHVPCFTRSLDAAITLVPEGVIWDVTSTGQAWVMDDNEQEISKAKTPALALCAAALKARAAGGDND